MREHYYTLTPIHMAQLYARQISLTCSKCNNPLLLDSHVVSVARCGHNRRLKNKVYHEKCFNAMWMP